MVERFGEYIVKQSVAVMAVLELIWGRRGRQANLSAKLHVRLAYQWPDNVEAYLYE